MLKKNEVNMKEVVTVFLIKYWLKKKRITDESAKFWLHVLDG